MELTVLINAFKVENSISDKSLSVIGGEEYSIGDMEGFIEKGFSSDNLVLSALNSSADVRGSASVERGSQGLYIVSSVTPQCGVISIPVSDINGVMLAVLSMLG